MPCKQTFGRWGQRQLPGIYFLHAAKPRETDRLEKIVPRPTRYCIPRAAENGTGRDGRRGLTSSRGQTTRRRASAFLRGDVREIKLDQPSAPPTSTTRKAREVAVEHAQPSPARLGAGLPGGWHLLINYERADVPLRSAVLSEGCSRSLAGGDLALFVHLGAGLVLWGGFQTPLGGGWEESCVRGEEAKFFSMRRNNVKTE